MKYKKFIFNFLLPVIFFSCDREKEQIFEVCGCSGSELVSLSAEGGVVAASVDGLKIISVNNGYLTPCGEFSTELMKEGQLLVISGRIIMSCKKEHSGYAVWSQYLEIEEIMPIDTLYQNGNLTIEIIRTEDYGKPIGFGYIVHDRKKNFRIVQTEIPTQVGDDPFKSPEDAKKIAYLVAHRLESTDDFPSVYLGDLHFLKILGM